MKTLLLFLLFAGDLSATVIAHFRGQFGNQLFQAAAAISLAMDNDCGVYFPDFAKINDTTWGPEWDKNFKNNYFNFLQFIPNQVSNRDPSSIFLEPAGPGYYPIAYQPNIEIVGYFLSEKYFYKHRNLIKQLFSISAHIESDLKQNYDWLIQKENTVAIHVRTGYYDFLLSDPDFYSRYLPPDLEYYKKSIELFDPDSLFVVFSDYIPWCKKNFQEINRNIIFIENQDYLHDFYLITLCKHAIIANSSFGWWAAYLNIHPEKKIVCRSPFFGYANEKTDDVLCKEWFRIPGSAQIPHPIFD